MNRRFFESLLLSFATMFAAPLGCSKGDRAPDATSVATSTGGNAGCSDDELSCSLSCVDPLDDPANCGACGVTCQAGARCSDGDCSCQSEFDECDGNCIDLSFNSLHCGECGTSCSVGQSCAEAECTCANGTACGDVCIDLESNSRNCGSCDNRCDASQTCSAGECKCHEELTECDTECAAVVSDPKHCGSCDNACEPNEVCSQGECATSCADTETDCDGACIADPSTNRQHCGKCGTACDSDRICVDGECVCGGGLTECDGQCVDTTVDASHCGSCGGSCLVGQGCSNGSCSCPTGQTVCQGTCVDVMRDPNNCGGCDDTCTGGQRCTAGSCACPPGQVLCGDTCRLSANCPMGSGGSGSGGTGGSGGASASGGSGGSGGTGGSGAAGGTGGTGGTASGNCTISASLAVSDQISTVGIVTFITDLPHPQSATIDFEPQSGGAKLTAPVDLEDPNYRTLLLGMKSETKYDVRITVNSASETCNSATYSLTTGPIPDAVPTIERELFDDDFTPGFIVTTRGISGMTLGSSHAYVFDQDGDIVWYINALPQPSRARMSFDGKYMWMMSLNVSGSGGRVDRVSMDGAEREIDVDGLGDAHHDLTVLPDETVAAIVHRNGCSGIIERAPDGTVTVVVDTVESLYTPLSDCHPNSIQYHASDDTYTISDRNPNLFVKITRQGNLLWQFGGDNPLGNHFDAEWVVNHGHQLLDNGHFLFFNNANGSNSPVLEYLLDESTWKASEVWRYESGAGSATLGDVQRLPNGHTIVTYSNEGLIHEVDASGNLVQSFSSSIPSFGYSSFRSTLYGPPPR